MIWRLVGYNEAGDEVEVVDLSADLIKDGNAIIVCPLARSMTTAHAERMRAMLDAAGIRAVVSSIPIQVWKVEMPE